MRFIYQYPETIGPDADMMAAGPVAELAAAAEAAGWEGFALTEHPVPGARWLSAGGHQTLDPFVGLGHAAAATERVILLTYLAVAPYRNPMLLAKAAASVDIVSNGRFVLGLGTGYLKAEFRALGVDFDERNALFDEALDVLPLHWSGDPFTYEGRHFDARDVIARPRPVRSPIPIWIGGNATVTLRRVAERAQGWMPLTSHVDISATTRTPHLATVDDLAKRIALLKDLAGSRAGELDIAVAYTDPGIAELDRDVSRHREAFAAYEEVGVTWVAVPAPEHAYPASLDFVDGFAERFIRG
ncbi:MAG TPA: LLM class F420-dependent oxidoreductase [Acidimicrobiia bacterium]|nr:LLM class F420-dependent oxidoreductase [Acidimicrobiia bacterium]